MNIDQTVWITANTKTMELDDMPLYVGSNFSLEYIREMAAKEFEISADDITSMVITWVPSRDQK